MSSTLDHAVLKTISYADIFQYPLTEEEIMKWLIKPVHNNQEIDTIIQKLKSKKKIYEKDGYYYLKQIKDIVLKRKKRKQYSIEKLKIANKMAKLLKIIPMVQLVGVTGSLAMENVSKNDDIDFLIISKSGWIWTTRFITTCLFQIFGIRRRPLDVHVNNKICLNMYLDTNHLSVSQPFRDIFSAHELLQMKVLWARKGVYEKFIHDNDWVTYFLPNAFKSIVQIFDTHNDTFKKRKKRNILLKSLKSLIENGVKKIQILYMAKRRTTEKISDGVIQFHPKDVRLKVLASYETRLKRLGLFL